MRISYYKHLTSTNELLLCFIFNTESAVNQLDELFQLHLYYIYV
jgi:hypothetical protein